MSAARTEALAEWDRQLASIYEDWATHPQRLRPVRQAMEERLLRGFSGLINELRQRELGVERYIWRSQDDAKAAHPEREINDL